MTGYLIFTRMFNTCAGVNKKFHGTSKWTVAERLLIILIYKLLQIRNYFRVFFFLHMTPSSNIIYSGNFPVEIYDALGWTVSFSRLAQ